MKKLLYVLTFSLIGLSGCNFNKAEPKSKPLTKQLDFDGWITIIEVDGCQYIFAKEGTGGGLTHKGNCKNKIHINNLP